MTDMTPDMNMAHDVALYVAENEVGWTFAGADASRLGSEAYERGWSDCLAAAPHADDCRCLEPYVDLRGFPPCNCWKSGR